MQVLTGGCSFFLDPASGGVYFSILTFTAFGLFGVVTRIFFGGGVVTISNCALKCNSTIAHPEVTYWY